MQCWTKDYRRWTLRKLNKDGTHGAKEEMFYGRVMSCSSIHLGNMRVLFPLVAGCLLLIAGPSQAQITLNVTNFGARGDAVQFFVNTTSNSVVITTTSQIPNSA
ncbi:MAG: hypothetical protein ABSC01_11170, partial [Verrucomicrobiota bacterium]